MDEINQGMDEDIERLAFSLTALEMPHVSVLFVFDASGLVNYDQWDLKRFIEAAHAKRGRAALRGEGASDRDDEDEERRRQEGQDRVSGEASRNQSSMQEG